MSARRVRDIEYELLRSGERKTADVVIERDGRVSVRIPAHLSEEQADAVVERKRFWIYRNLAEWRDLNATRVVREWVNGEGFLHLGASYRLLLVQEQDEPVKLKDGRFCLRRKIVEDGGGEAACQRPLGGEQDRTGGEILAQDYGVSRILSRYPRPLVRRKAFGMEAILLRPLAKGDGKEDRH